VNIIDQYDGENYTLANADCVEFARSLPDNSVGFTMTSPPYMALFSYSASDRDFSNVSSDAEFMAHFRFLVVELLRITKPGRLVAIDVMNVPTLKHIDGFIGIKDFRGQCIRLFQECGFEYVSEHCCWKDPLLAAVRTKALGLAHKTIVKDSSQSRAGLAQYLIAFRKPGKNEVPIAHPDGLTTFYGENPPTIANCQHADGRPVNLSHERWRRYASPVWMDIDFTNTLNVRAAREEGDKVHLCPMALDMIRRGLELWSAPGDVVFDPFSGVGSTGFCALEMGRKFIGSELKGTYYQQALKNLASAEPNATGKQIDMFASPTNIYTPEAAE
jgi:DNA modification methylase